MKIKLFIIAFICFLICWGCQEDEVERVTAPTTQDSYVDGTWNDSITEEEKGITLSLNLDENFGTIIGNGSVDFWKSNNNNTVNVAFTDNITGVLVNSQISVTIESPNDSDYVSFNGGLDKTDSTRFIGSCIYYLSSEHQSYGFQMTLKKQ